MGITEGAFAGATAGSDELYDLMTWAKAKGATISMINAMSFNNGNPPAVSTANNVVPEEAYLLNCDLTFAEIEKAKAGFVLTADDLTKLMANPAKGVLADIKGIYRNKIEDLEWIKAPETTTEAPVTEAPVTEAPVTEAPVTEAPATEAPTTEAPATEAPTTEAPTTEAPKAEGGCGGFVAMGIVACMIPAAVVICSKKKEN